MWKNSLKEQTDFLKELVHSKLVPLFNEYEHNFAILQRLRVNKFFQGDFVVLKNKQSFLSIDIGKAPEKKFSKDYQAVCFLLNLII